MTARRQENKGRPFANLILASVLAGFGMHAGIGKAAAASTERLVVDRHTGLAIGGYDPVAYFTDAAAMPGQPAFEASQGGAVWRFLNEGNRMIFLANPEIYGPQFGGYDPVDLVRGNIVAGRPQVWLIAERRLFMFNREDNRDKFAADPSRFMLEAADKWPALRNTLADY